MAQPKMPSSQEQEFRTEVPVRFHHADSAGIMFFGNIFTLAHTVLEDFVVHAGIGWKEWFASSEHAVPLRNVQADFLRPLPPGKTIKATLGLERLGKSSLNFLIRFWDEKGEMTNLVRFTCVFLKLETLKILPVPEEIRKRLIPFLLT